MKTIALSLALGALTIAPAFAAHNNPWATATDTVLEKNHDANQEQSVDTPGENEMHGASSGNADAGPDRASGHGAGHETADADHADAGKGSAGHGNAGNAGAGHGGAGHGGAGHGGKGRDG